MDSDEKRMRLGLVAFACCFLLVAGCSGSKPASTSVTTSAAPPVTTADTGSISGTVTDEEQRPLSGVALALLDTKNVTKSDTAGVFVFNDLAPGKHTLAAQMLGFKDVAKSTTVVAGEIARVALVLTALAPTNESIIDMKPVNGIIQCSFNAYYALNPCDGITGKDTSTFHFDVNRNWTWKESVFELAWTPTTAATAQQLEFDVCEFVANPTTPLLCADADYNKYVGGQSPQTIRVTDLPIKTYKDFLLGAAAAATGFSGTSYPVYQQSFTIYITHCYYAACPDDYSAIPK